MPVGQINLYYGVVIVWYSIRAVGEVRERRLNAVYCCHQLDILLLAPSSTICSLLSNQPYNLTRKKRVGIASTASKQWMKVILYRVFSSPPFHSPERALSGARIHFQTGPDWRLWVQRCDRYVGQSQMAKHRPKITLHLESRLKLKQLRGMMFLRYV